MEEDKVGWWVGWRGRVKVGCKWGGECGFKFKFELRGEVGNWFKKRISGVNDPRLRELQ